MDRLRSREVRSLLGFLREAYAISDLDEHRSHVVSSLAKVIPTEVTGYSQADVRQRRILWSTVNPPELNLTQPGARRINERHLDGNPVVPYHLRTGDTRAVTISDFLTRGQFHRLPLYAEWYRLCGIEYQLSVPVETTPNALSRVSLNRDRRDFTGRERLLVDLIRPHLLQAYRNAEALTRLSRENDSLRDLLAAKGQELIFLTTKERVAKATPRARRWLAVYFGAPRGHPDCIPDGLLRWITHQHQLLRPSDNVPPPRKPLVVVRNDTRLFVRLLSTGDERALLLAEERTSLDPGVLESLGLSRRQAEILVWVARGKTNEDIALILEMSRRTVEKHLESVYQKLGVENRTAAAARALAVLTGAPEAADNTQQQHPPAT